MEQLKSLPLGQLPLIASLEKVSDYLYFNGPLLSHFRGERGVNYFLYWCDKNEHCNRWLLFDLSEPSRIDYERGSISLLDVIKARTDQFVYVVDTDENSAPCLVQLVLTADLPKTYLPTIDSKYASKPRFVSDEAAKNYSIQIDADWSFADLGSFQHTYEQIYAFAYSLKQILPQQNMSGDLKAAFKQFPWIGGFSRMHFYNALKGAIPSTSKPTVNVLQYASPGWINLRLEPDVAYAIRDLVDVYREYSASIVEEVSASKKHLREFGFLGAKGKSVKTETPISAEMSELFGSHFDALAKLLAFPCSEDVKKLAANNVAALKILLSFESRVAQLSKFGADDKVTL